MGDEQWGDYDKSSLYNYIIFLSRSKDSTITAAKRCPIHILHCKCKDLTLVEIIYVEKRPSGPQPQANFQVTTDPDLTSDGIATLRLP